MKKKTKIWLTVISALLVIIIMWSFLFGQYAYDYDKIEGGVVAVENDGVIEFEYYLTATGRTSCRTEMSTPVLFDYDNVTRWHYRYLTVNAQRWNVWFNPGKTTNPYFILTPTGHEIHYGEEQPSSYTPEECRENWGLMKIKYIRVYYLNPDGTFVLIWEHPEAREIEARCEDAVLAPEEHRFQTRQ